MISIATNSTKIIRSSYIKYFFCTDLLEKNTVFPVEEYDVGQRLDRYLKYTPIGWASAQKHLRSGHIKVLKADGTVITKNSHKFEAGDSLLLKKGLNL
jgi:hypothetical protein